MEIIWTQQYIAKGCASLTTISAKLRLTRSYVVQYCVLAKQLGVMKCIVAWPSCDHLLIIPRTSLSLVNATFEPRTL